MSQHIPIVIIGDREDSTSLIRDTIQKCGSNTSILGVAKDLHEGCQIIHNRGPMVVVIDVNTEEIDRSLQMMKEIAKKLPWVIVFVVCGDSSPELILDFMRAGAHEYLLKPLSATELSGSFQKHCSRGGGRVYIHKPECKTYSVFSAKNGVGVTTIAVNLAVNIFEITKEPTIIVDLDLIGGDVTTFLDLEPAFTISHIQNNGNRVDKNFLQGVIKKHESGIFILAAPKDIKEGLLISGSDVTKLLGLLKTMFKYIVLDTEANFTQSAMIAIKMSELILMPFVMSLPSTKNTKKCLNHLEEIGIDRGKIRLVANRYLKKVQIKAEDAEAILGQSVFCRIPNDFNMAMTCLNKGVTLSAYDPGSTLNTAIRELAMKITGNVAELNMVSAEVAIPRMHKLFQVTSQMIRNFVS